MKRITVLGIVAALLLPGCIKVDNSLGKGLVDKSLLFDTYTETFDLEQTRLRMASDLSGFSGTRLAIGAIRDEAFGLSTRECAFPLIPALDTLDLGTNPKVTAFTLYFEADTVSCADDNQQRILQNLRVTELLEPLDIHKRDAMRELNHGQQVITRGLPVYNGSGPLTFEFTKEYGQRYVDLIRSFGGILKDRDSEDGVDRYEDFVAALPGIYIETEQPEGLGGRINLFDLSCLSVSNNHYYRNNNVAVIEFTSTWNGVQKDSSFLLIPGETEFVNEKEYVSNNTQFDQYVFNRTTHTTMDCDPTDVMLVEGGCGLKPVIQARELQKKTREAILAKGGDPDKAIIVKASIVLPYEMPEDFREMKYYPSVLSPTVRTQGTDDEGNEYYSFAGLTDASVSTENQGDIDRSNLVYSPDISYHLQELLSKDLTADEAAAQYDIWLLTIHTEKVATASGNSAEDAYYKQLLYANYYNSLYGGYGGYGYGGYGYGGYGGYGNYGYSNYYSYMMLAQYMAAQNQQTYSYTTELDKDRYYRAVLNGNSAARHPQFRITFAIPKD